jgi:hypothetical protein
MFWLSLLTCLLGPISDYIYFKDWWRPETLTGSFLSIEAITAGFAIIGIGSVISELVLPKKLQLRKEEKLFEKNDNIRIIFIVSLSITGLFITYYLFQNSLIATIIPTSIIIAIIWIKRRDLILTSIISGLSLMLTASLVYTIVNQITPGWTEDFWLFNNTAEITLLNLPLDDILWYTFIGAAIGPAVEFWQDLKD